MFVVLYIFFVFIGESMLFLMILSGGVLSFGIGLVVGVLVGVFIGLLIKGYFWWEVCEDLWELIC